MKLEVKTGDSAFEGKMINGQLRAASPGTAGMSTKPFELKVPSSIDIKVGPSQYEITLYGKPRAVEFNVYVDGKELQRGTDMVVEDDKGPLYSFEIK